MIRPSTLSRRVALERRGAASQRGVALVIALLFILMTTILALAGAQSTLFGERIAGNERDRIIALQAAEAAMRDAELYLRGYDINGNECPRDQTGCRLRSTADTSAYTPTCTAGQCKFDTPPTTPLWRDTALKNNAIPYGTLTKGSAATAPEFSMNGVKPFKQPEFLVERYDLNPASAANKQDIYMVAPNIKIAVYRIIAFGYGQNPNTQVVLEGVYFPNREDYLKNL
jgi:type IV pilus assembly protein PilX